MSCKLTLQVEKDQKDLEIAVDSQPSITFGVKALTELSGDPNNISYFTNEIDLVTPYETNINLKSKLKRKVIGGQLKGGSLSFNGFFCLTDFEKSDGCITHKGQFLGGYENFLKLLPANISDLDMGTVSFTQAAIEATWNSDPYDGITPVFWSLKKYGKFRNGGVTHVGIFDMRPDVFLKAIFEAIQTVTGTLIDSCFMATDWFKRNLHPYVGDGSWLYETALFQLQTTQVAPAVGTADQLQLIDTTEAGPWLLTLYGSGSLTIGTLAGGRFVFMPNNPGATGTVYFKWTVEVANAAQGTLLLMEEDGITLIEGFNLIDGTNEIVFELDMSHGDRIYFAYSGADILSGTEFTVCYDSTTLFEGVNVFVSSLLPRDLSTIDYLSCIFDIYNIVPYYLEKKDTLIVEPKYPIVLPTDEYCEGFYKGTHKALNWTEKLDCENEAGSYDIGSNLKRTFKRSFNDDSNDKGLEEDYLAFVTELSEKFPVGETENKSDCIAPTISKPAVESFVVDLMIPHFTPNEDDQDEHVSTDFEMRLLYKVGMVTGAWEWYSFPNTQAEYPYATQFDRLLDINLGFSDQYGLYGLNSTFHGGDDWLIANGETRRFNAVLSQNDIANLDFRNLLYLDTKDSGQGYWMLELINDYPICGCTNALVPIDVVSYPLGIFPVTDSAPPCSVRLAASIENCDYTINFANPADSDSFTLEMTMPDDSARFLFTTDALVTDDCSVSEERTTVPNTTAFSYRRMATPSSNYFVNGGHPITLRVWRSDTTSSVDLDIDPGGANLTGVHTVIAGDLIYNNASPAVLQTALHEVIENAIYNQIDNLALEGTHFELTVFVINTGPTPDGAVFIELTNKHNPVGLWVGFDDTNNLFSYDEDGLASTFSVTTSTQQVTTLPITSSHATSYPPCAGVNLEISWSTDFSAYVGTGHVYNDIPIIGGPIPFTTDLPGDNLTETCSVDCITATLSSCMTPVAYSWKLDTVALVGETTNQVCGYGAGTYQLTVIEAGGGVAVEYITI